MTSCSTKNVCQNFFPKENSKAKNKNLDLKFDQIYKILIYKNCLCKRTMKAGTFDIITS